MSEFSRPNIEAPLIVWEYAFALERKIEKLRHALKVVQHRTVHDEAVQITIREALGGGDSA